jgi:hypothetical protein
VSKAITAARVLAFPELGMEAIYEFEVRDMPVTVAVDARGVALGLHQQGFGLGVDIFRPDVAFLPFPVCVVFGLLEDSLGFGFEGFGFAYCGLEPITHFLLGIGEVGVLGEGGEVLLGF